MSRLGVISDGISRDLEHALRVARDAGLDEVELQYVWDREVGDLDPDETARVVSLARAARMPVSCISRHVFGGLLVRETEPGETSTGPTSTSSQAASTSPTGSTVRSSASCPGAGR